MPPSARPVRIPEWTKDAIWYQVFPERFCNGRPASNPRLADFTDQPIPGWRVMPWGHDWYGQQPWERKRGDFFRSVFARRYGGDLIGLREKLDYLQDLGVNSLYLNPVFHAASLHKYDATSLHHIDPTLGPDRAGDLRALAAARETEDPATWIWTAADRYFIDLVREIHRRGMRVILDGVFNHTGREFFAFRDLLARGRASHYRDWYKIKAWTEDGTFSYDGWFGHGALPEFAQAKGDLAPPVRRYLFDITRRWMDPDGDGDPADGIDGWRLDVAFCVPHGFWRKWRKLVKGVNPEAYTTAEIVTLAPDYLRGDEFDAVMNYEWLYAVLGFFTLHEGALSADAFRRRLERIRRAYPREIAFGLQNLLDSHDVGRVLTMLENRFPPFERFAEYFECSRVKDRPTLVTTRPGAAARQVLRQLAVFQAVFVGAPMIYYGTEVGLWGANDPCDRQPMLWPDVEHAPEARTLGGGVPLRQRRPDRGLFRHFQKCFRLRRGQPALRRGRLSWLPTGHPRVTAFARRLDGQELVCVFNAGDEAAEFPLAAPLRDLWNGGIVCEPVAIVPARGWRILAG
jgi:glycosidase